VSVDNVFAEPEKILHATGRTGVTGNEFAVQIKEGQNRRCPNPVFPEGEILLRGGLAPEVGQFQVALDIDTDNPEVPAEVFLDLRLIQNRGLHAVAEGTVFLFKENHDALFVLLLREAEFLP
jgi:hypothetical protein